MALQTGHLEDRYYARIILLLLLFTMKFFCIFFQISFSKKLYFFAFWHKKIVRHLVKVVLLYVVLYKVELKSVKKYMEVSQFLLLICSYEK